MAVTNEGAVGLPGLMESRRAVWDYYRIEFLPDGYPGRRTGEVLAAHPIYGTYVIADYLHQYAKSRDTAHLAAARKVADAAIARMEPKGDALVFMYEPNVGISSLTHRFYSGLTQARYLQMLGRLAKAAQDPRYTDASSAIVKSLLIDAADGGVARTTPHGGTLIEEYTHPTPDYTLNGWTTATLLVDEYATSTADPAAAELVGASRRGIEDVLPLYDVPELANSRYRLAGRATLRLDVGVEGWTLSEPVVQIPGQGAFPFETSSETWGSRMLASDVPTRRALEVILNRVSWPAPNRFTATVTVPEPTTLGLELGHGAYNPLMSWLTAERFERIATIPLHAGANAIEVPIPWDQAELVAYPTSWGKRIAGEWFNQYHFIHVDTLRKLSAREPNDLFDYFSARWAAYPARWPDIREISTAGVAMRRYGTPAASDAPATAPAAVEPAVAASPGPDVRTQPRTWATRVPGRVRRRLARDTAEPRGPDGEP